MVTQMKKSCPNFLRLNKKSFSSYEAEVPEVLKSIQPPFSYTQADIFGPIFAFNNDIQLKSGVLVNLCWTSRAVHPEILHSYTARVSSGIPLKFSPKIPSQFVTEFHPNSGPC